MAKSKSKRRGGEALVEWAGRGWGGETKKENDEEGEEDEEKAEEIMVESRQGVESIERWTS